MLSILIVEDDLNFRTRFAEIVESCADFRLVGAVGTCAEARACLAREKPDVLLCDLGLPDGDGAEIVREACHANPALDAMVVTVFGDEAHVMRSLEVGAIGKKRSGLYTWLNRCGVFSIIVQGLGFIPHRQTTALNFGLAPRRTAE